MAIEVCFCCAGFLGIAGAMLYNPYLLVSCPPAQLSRRPYTKAAESEMNRGG